MESAIVQLGFAIIVSDEVHNAMRRLQLTIANACGANPALKQTPHITLKQPFHARNLEPIERYFDGLVTSIEPFEIHLSGFGHFEEDGVVFLDVAPEPRLEGLRLRLLRELSEQFGVAPRDIEDDRYRFHATLAYGLTPENLAKARELLADEQVDLRFTTDTLALFYNTGEFWITYKRARITPSPPGRGLG